MKPPVFTHVLELVDADITRHEAALARLRQARTLLAGEDRPSTREGKRHVSAPAPTAPAMDARDDAAEAIAAELAKQRGPVRFAAVRTRLKLSTATAGRALAQLVAAKRAVRQGWSVGTPDVMAAAGDAEED